MTETENQAPQAASEEAARQQTLQGVVVSARRDKTITVQVERLTRHPQYHKTIRVRKKFYAHDENNEANEGDAVVIVSTRPLSKTKRWRLKEISRKAAQL